MEKHSREPLSLRQELSLALLPTVVVLLMLGYVEAFSRQRLLFASLASSAFLIYLDPEHPAKPARVPQFEDDLASRLSAVKSVSSSTSLRW